MPQEEAPTAETRARPHPSDTKDAPRGARLSTFNIYRYTEVRFRQVALFRMFEIRCDKAALFRVLGVLRFVALLRTHRRLHRADKRGRHRYRDNAQNNDLEVVLYKRDAAEEVAHKHE